MKSFLRQLAFRFVTSALLAFAFATPAHSTIQYQISLDHPEQHTFHIKITVPNVNGSVTVQMPAWNALYEIRDFSAHVSKVEASDGASPLGVEKLDKQTWRITGTGTISISYDTFWDEPGPFADATQRRTRLHQSRHDFHVRPRPPQRRGRTRFRRFASRLGN